jgi:GT2 family glycosyltransferase
VDPTVSFIIPTCENIALTRACLESLLETTEEVSKEILVIDDASKDGTQDYLRGLSFPPFQILLNSERLGYARSNNTAARRARGEILCLLNNDLILPSGWFKPMERALRSRPDAGIIGNVQICPRTGRHDHWGIIFNYYGVPDNARRRLHLRQYWEPVTESPAVTAACCMMWRRNFEEVGGFDEGYLNSFEDIDLCLKMRQKNLRHYVANQSVAYHYVSSSPGRMLHNHKNLLLFVKKWSALAPQLAVGTERWWGKILNRFSAQPQFHEAIRYLRKHWFRPWRYNGPRLAQSLRITWYGLNGR